MADEQKPPTFNELVEALHSLQSASQDGISKHIAAFVVALTLGLAAWVGSSVLDMKSTVDKISVTTGDTKGTVSGMSTDLKNITTEQAQARAERAELARRVEALERQR